MNLKIAAALAKFQKVLTEQIGKPVSLVLIAAFATLITEIMAATQKAK